MVVQSQFIARFGTTEQSTYPVKTLRGIALSSGEYGANAPATKYNPEKGRYIRITDIDEFGNLNDDMVSPEVADNKYLLQKGDLLFARTGATVGKTYLHKAGKALYAGYLIKYQFIEMFGKIEQVSIGSLFTTTSGGTPSRTKNQYYDGGTIPWLTSSEVGQGLIKRTESFITEDGLKNSSAKWVPKDSVVIAMYGATVGKVGLLELPCTTNQAVCSILPNTRVIPLFLLYAVKDKEDWMISQAAGAAQPNISQAIIRKMRIPLPSKEEQMVFVSLAKQADKSKFTGLKSQFIDSVLPEFVFAYTHSKEYYQWVELTQKVGAQPNISAKQYDGLRIVVPPFEEQKSFVGLMRQADKSKYLS